MTPFQIELVPCLKDNYAYLINDTASGMCAVVDPSEADPVEKALAARGWRLTHILNTHHHWDHTGGNTALKAAHGAKVVGPASDPERIPGMDIGVREGEPFTFGSRQARVLEIPAHTKSHIAFAFEEDKAVFTGDTLFAMGCGRLFEGTPQMMWTSLSKLMRLAGDIRIYCGHEYTLSNARFAATLEPGNADLQARLKEVEAVREKNLATIPSTMDLEKRTNPFLRPHSPEIRKTLGLQDASDVDVFAETRRRKDNF